MGNGQWEEGEGGLNAEVAEITQRVVRRVGTAGVGWRWEGGKGGRGEEKEKRKRGMLIGGGKA